MSILDSLNAKQRQAASVIDGALLILAGAGSGKTRTITTRLAYLVQEIRIPQVRRSRSLLQSVLQARCAIVL